jgi:hypothetical protein
MRSCGANRKRGAVLVLVVLVVLVVIALVGLALDFGYAALTNHQIQNSADAAALGAADIVRIDQDAARDKAIELARANPTAKVPLELDRNEGNDENGDIVVGRYERKGGTFRPDVDMPNAVKVVGRRTAGSGSGPLPLIFGPVFGTSTANLTRSAIAMSQGGGGAGFLVLCPDCPCALDIRGTSKLTVESLPPFPGPASIQVNSNNPEAVCGNGSLIVNADELNITGFPGDHWDGQPTLNCDINPGSPPMADPLAGLPAPAWDPGADHGGISGSGTFEQGYYSQGIRLTASGAHAVLQPGVYVVDGQSHGQQRGVYVNGGNLTANGVMFYVIGDGVVYLGGGGTIDITPGDSGPYEGVSIFQARDNTNDATIIGNGDMNLQGTYYFPVALVDISGVSDSLGNTMIAWKFLIEGTGVMTIEYDGRYRDMVHYVYLVQ